MGWGTIVIIAIVIFAIYTYSTNPEQFNAWKNKIMSSSKQATDDSSIKTTTTDEGILQTAINYGQPYNRDYFKCSSTDQCRQRFKDVDGIICDTDTGDCVKYVAATG